MFKGKLGVVYFKASNGFDYLFQHVSKCGSLSSNSFLYSCCGDRRSFTLSEPFETKRR
jgi:hypothetical protein